MELLRGILRRLGLGERAGDRRAPTAGAPEALHSVTIHIRIDSGEWACDDGLRRLNDLGGQIGRSLEEGGVGLLDGRIAHEQTFDILTSGADADRMWNAIAPVLAPHPFARGSHAMKIFGEPGPRTRRERIDLHWDG